MSGIPAGMVTVEAAVVWVGAWMFGPAVPELTSVEWRMRPPVNVPLPEPDVLAVLLARPRWHQPALFAEVA